MTSAHGPDAREDVHAHILQCRREILFLLARRALAVEGTLQRLPFFRRKPLRIGRLVGEHLRHEKTQYACGQTFDD